MQEKWGQFFNNVEYIVPLAVRGIDGEAEESTGWAGEFTKKEIAELQDMDDGVGKVKRWMEAGGGTSTGRVDAGQSGGEVFLGT